MQKLLEKMHEKVLELTELKTGMFGEQIYIPSLAVPPEYRYSYQSSAIEEESEENEAKSLVDIEFAVRELPLTSASRLYPADR